MSQSYLASLCSWRKARELPRVQGLGSKAGAVVRALASRQCGPGSNPQESFHKYVEFDRPGERSPE